MNNFTEWLNATSELALPWMARSLWQGIVVTAFVAIALVLWRKASPPWRYGLLLIALAKFLLPPLGPAFGLFAWLPEPEAIIVQAPDEASRPARAIPLSPVSSGSFQAIAHEHETRDVAAERRDRVISTMSLPEAAPNPALVVTAKPAPKPEVRPSSSRSEPIVATRSPAPKLTTAGWLLLGHLLGGFVLLASVLAQAVIVRRRARKGESVIEGHLYEIALTVARDLKLRRLPRICMARGIQSPQAGGLARAFVLLPEWVEEAPTEDCRAVIAHELTHLRRRDPWVNAFQIAAQIWLWWNPLVWWLNRRIRIERELCCDDMVLGLGLAGGERYSRILVSVADRLSRRELALEAIGMADAFRPIRGRVRRALDKGLKRPLRLSLLSLLTLLACACVLLPGGRFERESLFTESVTPRLSPDGERFCFSMAGKNDWGDPVTRIFVWNADGSDRREVTEVSGGDEEVAWMDNEQLVVSSRDSLTLRVLSLDGGEERRIQMPRGCDILYKRLAPDGKQVAFVGRYDRAADEREHGLFVVDLEKQTVRRLLDKALKSAPAWSPDSKRIAIGNAAGYVRNYPLVIVDVVSGEVTKTNVKGVGAAWSPDGRYLAFSTDVVRGGSWLRGVPKDVRIAVLDLESEKLTRVTPPATNNSFGIAGSLNPIWSPDSEWIAYHYCKKKSAETWVANREGTELRKVLNKALDMAWTPDSRSVVFVEGGRLERVALSDAEARKGYPELALSVQADAPVKPNIPLKPVASRYDPAPLFQSNRPWVNPELDHLQSVRFTHSMRSKRLDESFAWRRDGASLLEVAFRDDASSGTEIGRRWITTPEPDPGQYYLTPKARFAKREKVEPEFLHNYFRSHLMGTRTNFVALDWGRNPDAFIIRGVEENASKKTRLIRLAPREGKYSLNAGAMFQTTSWAYVHGIQVARSELTTDLNDHRILREVDYSNDGKPVCDIQFLDWHEPRPGQFVPRLIQLRFAPNDFEVAYRFQWRPEGLWVLSSGESRFKKSGEPQIETILDLEINKSVPEIEKALAVVRETEDYLRAGSAGEAASFMANPFALGKRIDLTLPRKENAPGRHAQVLFTLNTEGELVAKVDLERYDKISGAAGVLSLVLFGEQDRGPIAAAQAPFYFEANDKMDPQFVLNFGKSRTLGATRFFRLASYSSTRDVAQAPSLQSGMKERIFGTHRFALDQEIPIDIAADAEGKTKAKRARFSRNDAGNLVATVELISQDEWKGFPVVVSLILLGENGEALVASQGEVALLVEKEIVDARAEIDLGSYVDSKRVARFVVGVARGPETQRYHGHRMWMSFMNNDQPLFPVEQLLSSDEEISSLYLMGFRDLDRNMRDNYFRKELFSDQRDHDRAIEREETRAALLKPHLERFETTFKQGNNPEVLGLLCRLSGHSGNGEFRDEIQNLADHPEQVVRDGAAVGLGLLGDGSEIKTLGEILSRPLPEIVDNDRTAWTALSNLQTDAAIALGEIGSDDAVRLMGEALVRAVEGTVITPGKNGGYYISGTHKLAGNLVLLLGRTKNPIVLTYFKKATRYGYRSERVSREITKALRSFKKTPEVLDVVIEGIRSGGAQFVQQAPRDKSLVPEVRKLLLRKEISEYTFWACVQFLREVKDPSALEALREARRRDQLPDYMEGQLLLSAALADYGDRDGLVDGVARLIRLMDPTNLPEAPGERDRENKDREETAEPMLEQIAAAPEKDVAKILKPYLESDDRVILSAALQIMDALPAVPKTLKADVQNARARNSAAPPAPTAESLTELTANLIHELIPVGGCKTEKTEEGLRLPSTWRQGAPRIETRHAYQPPFALNARAMTNSTNIRLYFGNSREGMAIFNWEVRPSELRVHDLLTGQYKDIPGKGAVSKDKWHEFRWEIRPGGMRLLVDGDERYRAEGNFENLTRALGIGPALGSTVTVSSFVIEPLEGIAPPNL